MSRNFAQLVRIDQERPITKEADYEFLYLLQNSLLLALKEQGRLSEMQYRHAADKLGVQRRERARKLIQERDASE